MANILREFFQKGTGDNGDLEVKIGSEAQYITYQNGNDTTNLQTFINNLAEGEDEKSNTSYVYGDDESESEIILRQESNSSLVQAQKDISSEDYDTTTRYGGLKEPEIKIDRSSIAEEDQYPSANENKFEAKHISWYDIFEKIKTFFAPKKHTEGALRINEISTTTDDITTSVPSIQYIDENESIYGVASNEQFGHVVIGYFPGVQEDSNNKLTDDIANLERDYVVPSIRNAKAYIDNKITETTSSNHSYRFCSMAQPDSSVVSSGDEWEQLRPSNFIAHETDIYTKNYFLKKNDNDYTRYERINLPPVSMPIILDTELIYDLNLGNPEYNLTYSVRANITNNLPSYIDSSSNQKYIFAQGYREVHSIEDIQGNISTTIITLKGFLGKEDSDTESTIADETSFTHYTEYVRIYRNGKWSQWQLISLIPLTEENTVSDDSTTEEEASN